MTDKTLPFAVCFDDGDTSRTERLIFRTTGQIERHFQITNPLSPEAIDEIMEIAARSIVHACICPYAEDVHGENCLMIAATSSELARASYEAAMDI